MPRYLPNETDNKVALFGTEVAPGVPVLPISRLRGEWNAQLNRALERTEEATGTFDRFVTPRRQAADPTGSYSESSMSFESFSYLLRYGFAGGGVGVSDGEDIPGFIYSRIPAAIDDVDTMTIDYGIEGLAHEAAGVRWNEFTISGSAVDTSNPNWQFSGTPHISTITRLPGHFTGVATGVTANTLTMTGAGWTIDEWVGAWVGLEYGSNIGEMRRVLSNTADTLTFESPEVNPLPTAPFPFHIAALLPIVADEDEEVIPVEGTKLFIDGYDPVLKTGTTDVSERIVSFNATVSSAITAKTRLPGRIGRVGRGTRIISGTIRFEDDRWDERKQWEDNDFISLRIFQEGSVIDPDAGTNKFAQIDVNKAVWDTITPDEEGSNMTTSISFLAYLPIGTGNPIAKFDSKILLPTLP